MKLEYQVIFSFISSVKKFKRTQLQVVTYVDVTAGVSANWTLPDPITYVVFERVITPKIGGGVVTTIARQGSGRYDTETRTMKVTWFSNTGSRRTLSKSYGPFTDFDPK
jgi:hypothetical protein